MTGDMVRAKDDLLCAYHRRQGVNLLGLFHQLPEVETCERMWAPPIRRLHDLIDAAVLKVRQRGGNGTDLVGMGLDKGEGWMVGGVALLVSLDNESSTNTRCLPALFPSVW